MNVRKIVEKYLEENGHDGLAGDQCGCLKDDLFMCDSCPNECVAGHRVNFGSPECQGVDGCEWLDDCKGMPAALGYCVNPGKKAVNDEADR